jgi:hypothetical protein
VANGANRTMSIVRACPNCQETWEVLIDPDDARKYFGVPPRARPFVQDAFPYLTLQEREIFLTAFCAPCWDLMFKET